MSKSYPIETVIDVIDEIKKGDLSISKIADKHKVARPTVWLWKKKWMRNGKIIPDFKKLKHELNGNEKGVVKSTQLNDKPFENKQIYAQCQKCKDLYKENKKMKSLIITLLKIDKMCEQ